MIRGGGWSFDMLLRSDNERLEQEMKYALDMNLNTIRLEGKIESDYFFSLADRLGMLVMPGWCCCDAWEHWGNWTAEDKDIAADSLRSQLLRNRMPEFPDQSKEEISTCARRNIWRATRESL